MMANPGRRRMSRGRGNALRCTRWVSPVLGFILFLWVLVVALGLAVGALSLAAADSTREIAEPSGLPALSLSAALWLVAAVHMGARLRKTLPRWFVSLRAIAFKSLFAANFGVVLFAVSCFLSNLPILGAMFLFGALYLDVLLVLLDRKRSPDGPRRLHTVALVGVPVVTFLLLSEVVHVTRALQRGALASRPPEPIETLFSLHDSLVALVLGACIASLAFVSVWGLALDGRTRRQVREPQAT